MHLLPRGGVVMIGTIRAPGDATRLVRRNAAWDAKLCTTGQAIVRRLRPEFWGHETGEALDAPDYLPAGGFDRVDTYAGMQITMREGDA